MVAIMVVCIFTSCTGESFLDETDPIVEQTVNRTTFDEESEWKIEIMRVMHNIVEVHKDFENFQAALPKSLCGKMISGKFNFLEGLEIMRYWYENDECYDVLCEWPEWDTFIEMLPTSLLNQFEFYL